MRSADAESSGAGRSGAAPAYTQAPSRLTPPPAMEIQDELGGGAQAVVYRARRQDHSYALKILRTSAPLDSETGGVFRREAAALTRVGHPGLALMG